MSVSGRHIVICNERIVFRYGVDRILLELARMLISEGWRITFVCLRCETDVVCAISPHLHVIEDVGGNLFDVEATCARYLEENWDAIEGEASVDAVVCGGFPFFHIAAFGQRRGVPTIFIDAGAVPHDGMSENQIAVQKAVRRLRVLALPHFDRVLPISEFIKEAQTIPDRGSAAGVVVVPLGVDHLAARVFSASGAISQEERLQIERLERLLARNTALILNLGRFEAEGYKNSGGSFRLLRELLRRASDADGGDIQLLLLGKAQEIEVPLDLQNHVICLGFPSDEALTRVMMLVHAGFSPSLWEGFNLPIGEMQILGKPAFAFNLGAHPEVILHPWFLCATIEEAAEKIECALANRLPHGVLDTKRAEAFRARFTWRRANEAYRAQLLDAMKQKRGGERPRLLFVDVTNSSRDTANSGVVRVTRRLSAELQAGRNASLFFVYWDAERQAYRFVAGERENLLKSYNGPSAVFGALAAQTGGEQTPEAMLARLPDKPSWRAMVLLPEVVLDGETDNRLAWARRYGVETAAILYDLIPIEFPQYCGEALCEIFPSYIEALASADRVIAISAYSLECFNSYVERKGLRISARTAVAWLPGQLAASKRVKVPAQRTGPISIVCVSTIEPRKNHGALLAAYRQLRRSEPHLKLRLTLIGNLYSGADHLAETIRQAIAEDPTIRWRVAISDDELLAEMHDAAFTVYPSLVEGFGLPILESLWAGRPCICHDKGVMAELAADGGCVVADMNDAGALAAALKALAVDENLHARLAAEARAREICDWSDYAREVAALLWTHSETAADVEEEPALALERSRVERAAYFLRHRLNGLGLLGERAAVASNASATLDPPPAVRLAPQAKMSWLARLLPRRRLTVHKVRSSGFFDDEWYLTQYPDVREAGFEAIEHFVKFGHREARSPGPGFDAAKYLAENPSIQGTKLSPFEYMLFYG